MTDDQREAVQVGAIMIVVFVILICAAALFGYAPS